MWVILGCVVFIPIAIAWIQYLVSGLPADPSAHFPPITPEDPTGFPAWLRISHWANFLFIVLLIRSGISILMDHPRLYFNNSCKPFSEWIRFTPVKDASAKEWTAKDDARYISPWAGLPGYRHTIGLARIWHFLTVPLFVLNGVIFIALLFLTDQWQRLVPMSWQIIPDAWNVFVHYATLNMPIEPDPFYHYNALQQVAYFSVIFVLAPLAMVTGLAMSPAIESRFPWYPKLFGNRQTARSIHFMVMISYVLFIIGHVTLVVVTGFKENMNHIVLGTQGSGSTGMWIGLGIIALVGLCCYLAAWLSWHRSRTMQKIQKFINNNLWYSTIDRFHPKPSYTKDDISSYFWANGKLPESEEWRQLVENDFKDYKLKVGGLVETPCEFTMEELKKMVEEENITMHHCIQGWSGIAQWKGTALRQIIDVVKPLPEVGTVAFYSFGEGLYGGTYYSTHTLSNCMKPGAILAWEMNYEPLPINHGAPLRLRIENQLGYKMVKWIKSIEFVKSHRDIGKGFGGKNEDDEYFDLLAST